MTVWSDYCPQYAARERRARLNVEQATNVAVGYEAKMTACLTRREFDDLMKLRAIEAQRRVDADFAKVKARMNIADERDILTAAFGPIVK